MYAIIKTGGKQLKIEEGQVVRVEKIDAEVGADVKIDTVLCIGGDKLVIGNPYVENASVAAEVVEHGKAKKILIFKKKRRHGYRKKQGHRQSFTSLRIKKIVL